MYALPDHPAIRRAERTGYPFPVGNEIRIGYCSICGRPIYEYDRRGERGFIDPEYICEDCLLELELEMEEEEEEDEDED